jgi:predicted SnoaL-like aldol condensation-catalyzing enzyme
MSAERNKDLIRRVFEEGVSHGRWEVITDAFAEHCVVSIAGRPAIPHPPSELIQRLQRLRDRMPDVQAQVVSAVAEGNDVATIERWTGTDQATGVFVDTTAYHLFHFEDGKVVVEHVSEFELRVPMFTTRTWTFKPGAGEQGLAALHELHRVASSFPNVRVRLFRDLVAPDRFVTVGEWPERATFRAFGQHADMASVRAQLQDVLVELYPSDNAIIMQEVP